MLNVTAGKTVTITGTVDAANRLFINIPANSKVIWKATLTASRPAFAVTNNQLIFLAGSGDFEVTEGGTISAEGDSIDSHNYIDAVYATGNISVTISGGTVSADGGVGNGKAISATGNVTVSGGTVSAGDGGIAIHVGTGDVTVSGGTVSASGKNSKAIHVDTGNVTISGSTISASGTGSMAILVFGIGDITVSGGTVSASGDNSIVIYGFDPAYNALVGNTEPGSIKIENAVLIASGADSVMTGGGATVIKTSALEFINGAGTVTGATTLTQDFTLPGDLTIPAGAKLTIAPGVTLALGSNKLTNNGTIVKEGTIDGDVIGNQPLTSDEAPPDETPKRHNGGCGNVGFGAMTLLLAATLILKKRG
ncbi:hypothetical protein FACS1894204_00040 [Synergistales bacterium]|nr:hypothetical protein FACS1894204_00040 [Synergistales bacterium]